MGRGDGKNTISRTSYRHRPGEPASRAQREDLTRFSATIRWKMFPKKGQPEKEDGFTIAKATHEITGEEIVLKGKYGPVIEGQLIQVKKGTWKQDARWGAFFLVWQIAHTDPVTREAIEHYLEHLPGIGPKMAEAIVAELGATALTKIDHNPDILLSIKTASGRGIDPEKLAEIAAKWDELRADRTNMIFLSSLGLGDATARLVSAHFRAHCIDVVRADPYQITAVDGVGFKLADLVAEKSGIQANDPRRLAAGMEYLLEQAEGEGHICLTRDEMMSRAPSLLERDGHRPNEELLSQGLEQMIADGRLWIEESDIDGIERVYTKDLYVIETRLLGQMERLLTDDTIVPPPLIDRKPEDSILTDEQWHGVANSFKERLSVLTGGPGTGKTTNLKNLLETLERQHQDYACLAPTGKAAKRMEESTGREASTIHRRLGWKGRNKPGSVLGAERDKTALLDVDVVVIDEASMLDMRLAERVFSHLGPKTRVVLVGDPDQLPPVGAGSVLLDLIESKRVPLTRLTKVHRQAEGSLLVVNANRIKDGIEPYWSKAEAETALGHEVREDWRFIETENAQQGIAKTLELARSLPEEMGISVDEVLVTAPSRKGAAGVYVLNQALQHQRNPDGFQFRDGDQPLRVGDRVMNTQNRYGRDQQPDIMNGDMGTVARYDAARRIVHVDFDEGPIVYSSSELDALIPAYCATTHKLQGSEAPAIITPLVEGQNSRLLSRNLCYTAQTRAKEMCVVVGDQDVLRSALKRDGTERNTTLDLRVGIIEPKIAERVAKLGPVGRGISDPIDLIHIGSGRRGRSQDPSTDPVTA